MLAINDGNCLFGKAVMDFLYNLLAECPARIAVL